MASHALPSLLLASSESLSLDKELEEWKRARRFHFPWRPFSLVAGILFGAASFILPDTVNQMLQWPLLGLSAIAFFAGLSAKRSGKPTG